MKVYVENGDIPKRCIECRFCYYSEDEYCHCCRINGINIENKKCWRETHTDCPLLSIADYTKQVRKEVAEEIRNRIENYSDCVLEDYENPEDTALYGVFKNILEEIEEVKDQIQGETK